MTPTLPRELTERMASREHRLHHWLWHEVRNSWLSYPDEVKEQIRGMGWEPPRPALNERRRPILDNDAGEDFLYMHREMLIDASRVLAQVKDPNYPRILVWKELPAPGDPDFPVPPAWVDPSREDANDRKTAFETLQRIKSDVFYEKRLISWQRMFTDPAFLRSVTLGELGVLMEQSVHASMHMRWASAPAGFRPDPEPTQGNTIAEIWDDPRYDFLGDTYASHVHPVFWSLHGWVDDRVEDWKVANGVYGNNFWKGTWVGKRPGEAGPKAEEVAPKALEPAAPPGERAPTPDAGMPGHEQPAKAAAPGVHAQLEEPAHAHPAKEEMEELVAIIGRCGVFHEGYYARVSYTTFA